MTQLVLEALCHVVASVPRAGSRSSATAADMRRISGRAFGLFPIGFEWLGVTRLRGARTRDDVVTWMRVVSLPRVIAPATQDVQCTS